MVFLTKAWGERPRCSASNSDACFQQPSTFLRGYAWKGHTPMGVLARSTTVKNQTSMRQFISLPESAHRHSTSPSAESPTPQESSLNIVRCESPKTSR